MGITPTKGDTHFPVIWARFSKKTHMYRTVSNRCITPPPNYTYTLYYSILTYGTVILPYIIYHIIVCARLRLFADAYLENAL